MTTDFQLEKVNDLMSHVNYILAMQSRYFRCSYRVLLHEQVDKVIPQIKFATKLIVYQWRFGKYLLTKTLNSLKKFAF